MRHNEGYYQFLDRCAVPYFGDVRDLLEDWLARIPAAHQPPLLGSLQSGNDAEFEAAFWELYLHEAYVRSGHVVTIHPVVAGSSTKPDFLIETSESRFYLEAVRVGLPPARVGRDSRLADVYAVLDSVRAVDFTVIVSSYEVGPQALATRPLRSALRTWLSGLDPRKVSAQAHGSSRVGYDRLPDLTWSDAGWHLVFHAMPFTADAAAHGLGLVGAWGPGEATVVENVSRLRGCLDSKANKYGALDAPLAIAVLANTEYPTKDYEVEQALYGISSYRPPAASLDPSRLFDDGHWLTKRGWRRGHAPQTIVAERLSPSRILRAAPQLWTTLEPGVTTPLQPAWLAQVDVTGMEIETEPGDDLAAVFGLPSDWRNREPEWDDVA